jgi:lysophospholipase L1-like esterase
MLTSSATCGRGYRGFAQLEEDLAALGTFTRITVDAVYSRNAAGLASTRRHGAKTIAQYLRKRPATSAILVALGSNDLQHSHRPAYFEQQIRAVMTAAGPRPVAWVNVFRSDRPYYVRRSATFNAVLARLATEYPNLTVVDWYSTIRERPAWQAFDKLHLQPVGYRARVPFYVDAATRLGQMLSPVETTTTVAG